MARNSDLVGRCAAPRPILLFSLLFKFYQPPRRTADLGNIDGKNRQFLAYRRRLQPLCRLAFSLR